MGVGVCGRVRGCGCGCGCVWALTWVSGGWLECSKSNTTRSINQPDLSTDRPNPTHIHQPLSGHPSSPICQTLIDIFIFHISYFIFHPPHHHGSSHRAPLCIALHRPFDSTQTLNITLTYIYQYTHQSLIDTSSSSSSSIIHHHI